jgi:hypothetical protein
VNKDAVYNPNTCERPEAGVQNQSVLQGETLSLKLKKRKRIVSKDAEKYE